MRIFALVIVLTLGVVSLPGCNKNSGPQNTSSSQTAVKRYHLKGKVVSVDKRANMVNVDGEAIPGFMDAMMMPYSVKPAGELDKLTAGDNITADVVVQDDNSWLENIAVTGHSAPPK